MAATGTASAIQAATATKYKVFTVLPSSVFRLCLAFQARIELKANALRTIWQHIAATGKIANERSEIGQIDNPSGCDVTLLIADKRRGRSG